MADLIAEIFKDEESIRKLKTKLPYMFKLVELEVSKGGRVGMEVGTLREKVIVSFLRMLLLRVMTDQSQSKLKQVWITAE